MPAEKFTKRADTPAKKRQWKHVYEGMKERGYGAGRAIMAASSVVKKHPAKTRSSHGLS